MSWGIWKKIKQSVAKVGGFVRNLLGGAPKVINNTMDTVNTLGKKAMRGVKRASKIVQQFRNDETESESEDEYEEAPESLTKYESILKSIPKFKPKIKTKSIPKWRKLLDRDTKFDDETKSNYGVASKYTVNYAGRSWMPKMKPKNKVKSSQKQLYSTIDDSEDLTE